MRLNFKNLPVGSLPYNDIQPCKKMMLRLYEKLPFLPELPLIDKEDNIIQRTFNNLPGLMMKEGKLILQENNSENFGRAMIHFEKIFNSQDINDFQDFSFNPPFMNIYEAMLEKFLPEYTVIHLIGPFSFANMVFNINASLLLTDRFYRKYIIQAISVKALWFIHKVKSISPKTKPIIMFNEDSLYKFGTLKRTNEYITNDIVTELLYKVFQRIKKEGAIIGVQSFGKCNWQLVLDTNLVDIISIDAYNNPRNLNILAQSVNNFLAKGGYINWGIIPVMNETVIRTLNIEQAYSKFVSTVEELASNGVSADLLYKNSTVSVQGDLSKFPILFAEKALILTKQLSDKIPKSSGTIQSED